MRPDIGGVAYDEAARLQFGAPDDRRHLSLAHNPSPRVELHLRLKGAPDTADNDEDAAADPVHLEESAQEARLAGLRLLELKTSGHPIWDEDKEVMRPVEWADMAVLLRSPSGKSENFTKEFARLGIPLTVARSGFYDSMEIADLISLLQLLDNPLQDIPALAVLHSPLVGMSPDELAAIRLAAQRESYWTALLRFHESQTNHSAWPKADRFLKDFFRWRRLARQISLSRCLETVLNETHYGAWLFTQSRGTQRHANVQRLLALARQFDQFQRQGLARFLHFVDAQKEAETEPAVAPISGGDSVTLMSIHQSKGLEFPVVVLADLGKPFNFSDLTAEIILDEKFGLCPRIKPPHTGRRYPSLPYWLARQRQKQETLGEELRLLYVAMTRARDTLILTGNLTQKKFESRWLNGSGITLPAQLDARNYLDWLAAWTTHSSETFVSADPGQNQLFRWIIYETSDIHPPETASTAAASEAAPKLDAAAWNKLQQRLAWKYPHEAAIDQPAKTSVTAVRRRLTEEVDEAAAPLFKFQFKSRLPAPSRKLSATEIGLAHHTFLQHVSLEQSGTIDGLKQEAARLADEKFLTAEEAAHLDLSSLAAFWQSELGKKIRAKSDLVRRELAFTARMSPAELAAVPGAAPDFPDQEFVVVQGAADLIVLQPEGILLVDFKTDHFAESQLADKVKIYEVQLRLYAKALECIYQRPVNETYLHFLALRKTVPLKFK
jgi:ATP-dependent helicase/nuclease subunit A